MATNEIIKEDNFNQDDIRALRIAKILLDVGTDVIQRSLIKVLKDKNKTLEEFLTDNKARINPNNDVGASANIKFFYSELEYLYPRNEAVDKAVKFDISLCYKLFLIVEKIKFMDHLRNIKKIRDENYGHVVKLGLKKKQFENTYRILKDSIEKICKINEFQSKTTEIEDIFKLDMNHNEIKKLKNRVTKLIAEDVEFKILFLESMKELNIKVANSDSVLNSLNQKNTKDSGLQNKILNQIHNIFQNLKPENFKKVNDKCLEKLEKTNEELEKANEMSRCILNEFTIMNEKLNEMNDKLNLNITMDEITKKMNLNNLVNCNTITFHDFEYYFSKQNSMFNFKILILDIKSSVYENMKNDLFFETIAFSSWNLIIDLNPQSNMEKAIKEQSKRLSNFVKLDYSHDQKSLDIKSNDRIFISDGTYKCYIKVNLDDNPNLYLQRFNRDFERFLEEIVDKSHSIMCTNLIIKDFELSYYEIIEKINCSINNVLNKKDDKEELELIYLIFRDLVADAFTPDIRRIIDKQLIDLNKKMFITSSDQFYRTNKRNADKNTCLLPAENNGEIEWLDNISYKGYFEVYHKQIGEKELSKNDIEYINNKVIAFIKGNEIDPETIYINNDFFYYDDNEIDKIKIATYVESEQMSKIYEEILKESKKTDFFRNNKSLVKCINVSHYCGGTTIGRVLLYKLKNTLPCVLLRLMDTATEKNETIEGLKEIKKKTNLPIVILIDTDCKYTNGCHFTRDDAEMLSTNLGCFNTIEHFIIYVDHSHGNKFDFSEQEINLYKAFYKKYLNIIKPSTTLTDAYKIREYNLILIRLLYLEKNINEDQINKIADEFLSKFSKEEKNLLLLMHFFETHSISKECMHSSDLIVFILNIKGGRKNLIAHFENTTKDSKTYSIFSIFKRYAKVGFKLLNEFLSEAIVNLIIENSIDKKTKYEYFFDSLSILFDNILKQKHKNLIGVLNKFVEVFFLAKNENEHYSLAICNCELELGITKTELIIHSFYEKLKDNYDIQARIGLVYCRFMFFKRNTIEEKDESIKAMNKILKINNSLKISIHQNEIFKNPDILCSYGDLLRHYINESLKYDERKSEIKKIFELTEDCILAYDKSSQLHSFKSPLPLIGECKIRKSLLKYSSEHICKSNMKTYTDYLQDKNTPKIVKDSEYYIEKYLELLKSIKDNNQTNISYDINKLHNECRLAALKLRFNLKSATFDNLKDLNKNNYIVNYFSFLSKKWKELTNSNILLEMITHYENGVKKYEDEKETPLIFLFRDSILSYIHLAQISNLPIKNVYHIDRAIALTEKWMDYHKDDPDSYFFYGIFKLIKALQSNQESLFSQANENLKKCRKYYQSKQNSKRFKIPEYLIGKKDNSLESLILHNELIDKSLLKTFEGEFFEKNGLYFVNYHGLKIQCNEMNSKTDRIKSVEIGQKNTYKFSIGIKRSGLYVFDYEKL